jgi:hypothetical protein
MSSSGLAGLFASAAVVSIVTLVAACGSTDVAALPPDDAGADVAPARDAAMIDAAQDAPIIACMPADVTTFSPQPYVHAATGHQGVCTPTQIQAFYDDCLASSATQQTCSPFSGGNATTENRACAACLVSRDSDPKFGALVEHKGIISVNVPGCMELTDPIGGLMCAKAYQAADACERAACSANCPVTDDASFQLYLACVSQAAMGGCASFASALTCTAVEADSGASICFSGQTFSDLYLSVAAVFCGSAPDGGSTDAGRAD